MPLAAILCAIAPSSDRPDIKRGQIIFAAQTLTEYQARQAAGAGARELFILVEAVTPQLSRMVDRLIGDGIEVHLIRDMTSLVRLLPRESDVLLFADGMVVDQPQILKLAELQGNALLVVEDGAETSHLERIDTVHRWAGVARISPQILFNTLDLIGDWDFVLTLLRAAVQSDPPRIIVARNDVAEGRIALIDRQDTADLVSRSLAAGVDMREYQAGAERYVLGPVARMVAPRMLRLQVPARHLSLAAIAVALLGLMALMPGWIVPALLLFLLALTVSLVSDHIAAMGHMEAEGDHKLRLGCDLLVLAGVAWIGELSAMRSDGIYLALAVVIISIALHKKEHFPLPSWMCLTPASAVLLLLAGAVAGILPATLMAGALWGLASMGVMIVMRRGSAGD